jgi:hypothetical protein
MERRDGIGLPGRGGDNANLEGKAFLSKIRPPVTSRFRSTETTALRAHQRAMAVAFADLLAVRRGWE